MDCGFWFGFGSDFRSRILCLTLNTTMINREYTSIEFESLQHINNSYNDDIVIQSKHL